MAVKRYGVKTQSGSWYYIEDHTHLIGSPTWKIGIEGETFFIVALIVYGSRGPLLVKTKELIKNIDGFKDCVIVWGDKKNMDDADEFMLRNREKIKKGMETKNAAISHESAREFKQFFELLERYPHTSPVVETITFN